AEVPVLTGNGQSTAATRLALGRQAFVHGGTRNARPGLVQTEGHAAGIRSAGILVVAALTDAIPIATRIRDRALICVVAGDRSFERPGAAARRGIAGIASAEVAVLAIHLGVGAQARGFNAAVLSAWVRVAAVSGGALAHQGPCLVHARSARGTQAAIVAGITGIHKVTPADSALPAGVGGGASIAVGAGR